MQLCKQLCIGLTALLFVPFAMAATVSDISKNPNRSSFEYLFTNGVISGYPDGTFRPESRINRAELMKTLAISVGAQPDATQYHHCFSDVSNEWFAPYVCYAKEQSWIKGYEDGTFRPGNPVNTAEAIKMMVNAYGFTLMQSSSSSPYEDVDPSAWYAPFIFIARNAGIVDRTNGVLGTGDALTRERAFVMLHRSMRNREGQEISSESSVQHGAASRMTTLLGRLLRRGGGGGGSNERGATSGSSTSSTRTLSSPSITLDDLTKTYGDASFTISAVSNSVGDITYESSDTAVATIVGSTVTIVGAGTATITATQLASGDYTSGITTATLTVGKATSTVTLTTSSGAIQYSTSLTFTATVTSDATGTVSFYTGATLLGTSTIGHGSGSYTTTTLKRGTGSITAVYGGDTNFNGSTSNTVLQKVYNNSCLTVVCQHGGTCTNIGNSYSCNCIAPYAGSRCELSYDFCTPAYGGTQCFNGGTCVPSVAGGECQCAECYTGTYCDTYQPDICA